jgi:mannose-6-phosphate isomerase-like protein (cupin superfamily)
MIRIREIDHLEERASSMTVYTVMSTIVVSLLIGAVSRPVAAAVPTIAGTASYSNLTGRVVVDDERVLVQAFRIQPGQSTGRHTHHDAELLVFVKGGVLKSQADGRRTLWRDGRVVWLDPSTSEDQGSRNAGPAPIELMEVILKPRSPPAGTDSKTPDYGYLAYPNIPGEDVFENDRVIVQRFAMNPGEWEGVHAHHPNTLYIFIKGGQWMSKTTNPPSEIVGNSPDGDVAWMPATDISAGHQSGNIGTTPSDVLWIALKK